MSTESCKFTPILGNSEFTKNISHLIKSVSENSASVLLVGERGTGKRLIAQHIHYYFTLENQFSYFEEESSKENQQNAEVRNNQKINKLNKKDFFEVNCKSFSNSDIQMIFDGILRFIPSGNKVTLFINYIDELSYDLQINLLNLIKKSKECGIILKVISSSEKNLEELILSEDLSEIDKFAKNFISLSEQSSINNSLSLSEQPEELSVKEKNDKFSRDLFYHINTVVLNTLPLRLRKDDILEIAEYYREFFKRQSGFNFTSFSDEAKEKLIHQYWKGNIDELINSIQKAFITGDEPVIKSSDLGFMPQLENVSKTDVSTYVNNVDKTLKTAIDSFKRDYLIKILEENNWNQTKTAKILGIQRTYVIKLINELNIRK